MKNKNRGIRYAIVMIIMTIAFQAFATKWEYHSLYFDADGKMYAIEECVRKFLSTDGCEVGDFRYVEIIPE